MVDGDAVSGEASLVAAPADGRDTMRVGCILLALIVVSVANGHRIAEVVELKICKKSANNRKGPVQGCPSRLSWTVVHKSAQTTYQPLHPADNNACQSWGAGWLLRQRFTSARIRLVHVGPANCLKGKRKCFASSPVRIR